MEMQQCEFRRETGLAIPQKAPWQNGVMEHCLQPCAMKSQASEEELFVKAKKEIDGGRYYTLGENPG